MSAWSLYDPALDETWVMPINPDQMTTPHKRRDFRYAYGIRKNVDRIRSVVEKPAPVMWEWGGVIRSEAHHEEYVRWARKPGEVHVSDHLGRTFEVFIESLDLQERQPALTVPWRFRYTVRAMIVRRVS